MKLLELPVFYVEKILMIHLIVMRKCALNAIKEVIKLKNALKQIL
jgi:hypothetical protein